MITEKSIQTKKTARYYTIGKLSKNIKNVWLVLHGYGQLAKVFISEFECIANEENLIVAPEGLSRFYFRGFSGNIGASWMTKEDRENDILDYVNFINETLVNISSQLKNQEYKINLLGFSQGCHTAIRWLDRTKTDVNSFTMFGGSFPEDVNFEENSKYWSSIESTLFLGNKDRMVNKEKLESQIKELNKLDIRPNLIGFDGGHQINTDLLLNLSKNI